MAFDLYVGPASRYQARKWKTVGQQYAEAQGIPFNVIRPKESLIGKFLKPNPQKAYQAWRQAIKQAVDTYGDAASLWDDSEDQDYVTDRPGWEGQESLLIRFAHLLHPEFPDPDGPISKILGGQNPAMQAVAKDPFGPLHVLQHCSMFVPGRIDRVFATKSFEGTDIAIGSLETLDAALNNVCELWRKDRTEMGSLDTDQPSDSATLDEAATHGLAIYCRLTAEALTRNLPLIKDY